VRSAGSWVTLGDTLVLRRGAPVQLVITVDLANTPNSAGFIPVLARVDMIRGAVTGPVANKDAFTAPGTTVVKSFDVNKSTGQVTFSSDLGPVDSPFYLRVGSVKITV
jgi:hypothetical protein